MVDATGNKRTKEETERFLKKLEEERDRQLPPVKKGCDWCDKAVSSSCKTVAEYAKCRNK